MPATETPSKVLDALFPPPPKCETSYASTLHPGVTAESGKALAGILKDNHEKWHIFFNERRFHNHASHHLFAIYALGADKSLFDAAYATHTSYQKVSYDSPGVITELNWKDHMGEEEYYRAYVKFFATAILDKGVEPTLEFYFFSPESNFEKGRDEKKQPEMVNRLLSGVLHPLIHVGYALEFGTPGMLAEGLAMACVQNTDSGALVPASYFASANFAYETLEKLSNLALSAVTKSRGLHSFTILARMFKDPKFAPGVACQAPGPEPTGEPFHEVQRTSSDLILKYANEWHIDPENKEEIKSKVQELSFLVTLVYGVAGAQPGKKFNADFFTMHLVTSSLFIHSFVKHLSGQALVILLRTYLSTVLALWVSRGRPQINISHFYKEITAHPTPPGALPNPADETLNPPNLKLTPNPWLPIIQTTLVHPNEHLPKIQRALAHYAQVYGTVEAGTFAETELEGAEKLDGTVFIRVAGETANKIGWMREGEDKQEWEFQGFWG